MFPALFYALALYGLGFGLLFPALLELVARGSQAAWKGLATGFFFVFFSLGVALVPPFAGLLQQSQAAVSPFLTASVVSLLLILTLVTSNRTGNHRRLPSPNTLPQRPCQ
ncbi:MAG: MFS transporter [Bacillota bacterium]|nr:MFS transporter [Bacillota bacterium]